MRKPPALKQPTFKKHPLATAIHIACGAMLGALPLAHAGPTGGQVVGGTGTINQSGLNTTVNQASQNMAINWQSYNLGATERVQYIQPNASSISLNRILSNNGSTIAGRIDANGKVILVNPNGILFTSTASLNVGSLIASGLDINPNDFMNGKYIFNEIGGTSGTVVNQGLINASLGGNVALIGKQVKNEGLITANLGTVTLAAGKEAVLTFDNVGLLGVRVTKEILQSELGVDPAVINSGEIQAQGGRVLLTASQSQDIFSRAVNTGGLEPATSVVVNDDGTFTLGGGADVLNTGAINTSATAAGQNGGRIVLIGENVTSSGTLKADAASGNGGEIELHARDTTLLTQNSLTSARSESNGNGGIVKVLGDKVGLFDQSTVDVSGANGGGQALIGGDYQGKNSKVRNATRAYVSRNSAIYADAIEQGDGGKIINWSDDATWFYGTAYARGGKQAGNGGLVEVSGKRYLEFRGTANTTAFSGSMGTLLLDPTDIVILAGTGDTSGDGDSADDSFNGCPTIGTCNQLATILGGYTGPSTLRQSELQGIAEGTNIILEATNNITINDLDSNTLNLQQTDGSVRFTANSDGIGGGSFSMDASNTIRTQGGNVTIEGASITLGSINTTGSGDQAGGAITLTAGTGTISAVNLTSNGGTASNQDGLVAGAITITTPGQVQITGNISARGSAGERDGNTSQAGGRGGNVQITSSANTVQVGGITTNGGIADLGSSGGPANGGAAGTISISGTGITLGGNFNAIGGSGVDGGPQGNGGGVTLTGAVALAADVAVNMSGATRGNINFTSTLNSPGTQRNLSLTGGAITFGGAVGGAVGGTNRLGAMIINATGAVGAAANSIRALSLDVQQSGSFTSGTIDTSSTSADGGVVSILSAGAVSVGAINTSSSAALRSGGTINIGAAGITLNGDIDASGVFASQTAQLALTSAGTVTVVHTGNFTSSVNVTGSNVADTLVGANRDNAWLVTSTNGGSLNGNLTYTGIEGLTGGSGDDTFTFNIDPSSTTGLAISGGGQTLRDTVALAGGLSGSTLVVGSYTGIERYQGNANANTLRGTSNADSWQISGTNSGTVNSIEFLDFSSIHGGVGDDSFLVSGSIGSINTGDGITSVTVNAGGSVTGAITGGSGVDTITVLGSAGSIASMAGDDRITIASPSAITSTAAIPIPIDGGAGADDRLTVNSAGNSWVITDTAIGRGTVTNGGVSRGFTGIEGYVNTGGGNSTLDYSGITGTVDVYLSQIGGFSNIIGNNTGATTDTDVSNLRGTNNDTTWTINGTNSGEVIWIGQATAITFSGFNHLYGGQGADTFVFSTHPTNLTTGLISGSIRGGLGTGTNTLRGLNSENYWSITGNYTGNVNTGAADTTTNYASFQEIQNMRGGDGTDTFAFSGVNLAAATINGDGTGAIQTGTDSVNLAAVTGAITVQLGSAGFSNIENFTGNGTNGTNGTLRSADTGVNTWSVTANNAGNVTDGTTTTTFSAFDNLLGGNGVDNFTVNAGVSIGTIGTGGGATNSVTVQGMVTGAITGGSGVDTIDVYGTVGAISAGGENDILYVRLGGTVNVNVDGGAGNDTFTIRGTVSGNLMGGDGDDYFDVSGSTVTGVIDGGSNGALGDTIDVGPNRDVSIGTGIALVGFRLEPGTIEGVTSTGGRLHARNGFNTTWNITGVDSGNVQEVGATTGMRFSGFSDLLGSDPLIGTGGGGDIFNITADGSISGRITAGNGANQLNVTLTNTRTPGTAGLVYYTGGTGTDTITLTGNSGTGIYSESIAAHNTTFDRLSYTGTNGAVFTAYYSNIAGASDSVTDQVNASSLSLVGRTNVTNSFVLGSTTASTNRFAVNGRMGVVFSNKQDLSVVGVSSADSVNIVSNFSVPTRLTLQNLGTVSQATNTALTVAELSLNAVNAVNAGGATATALRLNGNTLLDVANSGPVSITSNAGVALNQISTAGALTVVADGNITDTDTVQRTLSGALTLTSTTGDIVLDAANQNYLTGPLALSGGAINVSNSVATNFASVTATSLTATSLSVNSGGDIIQTGAIVAPTANITATGRNVTLNHADNDFINLTINAAGGAVSVTDMDRNLPSSGPSIASGSITANSIVLTTANGIGSGAGSIGVGFPVAPSSAFTTNTASLTIDNQANGVYVSNTGPATVRITNNGDIGLVNTGSLTVDRLYTNGEDYRDTRGRKVYVAARGGEILAYSGPGARAPSFRPNIVADDLLMFDHNGVGRPGDPSLAGTLLSVSVTNRLTNFGSRRGFIYYYGGEPPIISGVEDFVSFDALDSLLSLRLIEIESLGEFDPAIFSEVRNYYHEDVAILMPADQRLDAADEDEAGKVVCEGQSGSGTDPQPGPNACDAPAKGKEKS